MNKKFILSSFFALLSLLCGMAFFTSCDFGTTEDEDGELSISKFISVNITRCERVGSVLVIEYDIKNKSNRDVQNIEFHEDGVSDNKGANYGNSNVGVVGGTTTSYYQSISLEKNDSKKCLMIVRDFDTSNTASKSTMRLRFNTEAFSDKNITKWSIEATSNIVDNRVLNHGIQTCDTGLAWEIKSIRRAGDGSLLISETVTNRTGKDLLGIEMHEYGASDDMGANYGNSTMAIEGSTNYQYYLSFNLDNNDSKTVVTRIDRFDPSGNARTISLTSRIQANNYLFSDDCVRLINGYIE